MKRKYYGSLMAVLLVSGLAATGQTPGTVDFTVRTTGTGLSNYNPKNIMAIWVTTESGEYVKTLKRRANNRIQYLYKWNDDSNRDVTDAVTGATLSNHQTHDVTWNCTDVNGTVVADGIYRIRVEMTTRNGTGPFTPVDHIEFTKGATEVHLTPGNETNFQDMQLDYTPTVDPEPNEFVARRSTWRFNDTGTDLHATEWKLLSYDHVIWGEQAAPLGYGGNGETSPDLDFGPDEDNKHPCYYFRKTFDATFVPQSATVYLRRDDGIVVYLNGHEIARDNMDPGATAYADHASGTVGGADETTYFEHAINPSLVVVGENIIVAEVHQASDTSSDMGFDLQLKAADSVPQTHHDIAVLGLSPGGGVPGDTIDLTVGVTNKHTTVENFAVIVSNMTDGVEIGRRAVTGIMSNQAATVSIAWDTGRFVPEGTYSLRAVAVPISGETSTADNQFDRSFVLRDPKHDIAIGRVLPVGSAVVGDTLPVEVTVVNSGSFTEQVSVVLSDLTVGGVVSTSVVRNLSPLDHAMLRVPWPTLGLALGDHTLQVVAVTVAGETNTADNMMLGTGVVETTGMGLAVVGETASIGGHAACVLGSGTTAYAGLGATLGILDLAAPVTPRLLGRLRLPGTIEALVAVGTTVFAATGPAGVQVVNAQDTAAPRTVSTFDTSGHAWDVDAAVRGDTTLLFVADGVSGLRILDVSDPRSPALLGAYQTEGPARALAVVDPTLYVVDTYNGLLVIDASDPTQPALLGQYDRIGAGQDVALSGTIAAVVDGQAMLSLVDVGSPGSPSLLGSLGLAGDGLGVAVSGTTAFVAVGGAGVEVIDISAPGSPSARVTHATRGTATGVDVQGGLALVADGPAGVSILNVATPASPTLAGTFGDVVRGADVAVSGDLAYVAAGESGLRIYSITNPALPVLAGVCDAGVSNARAVALVGTTALVADAQFGLRVVDVSTPATCAVSSTYTSALLSGVQDVAANGSRAVVTDGRRIQLLNLSGGTATAVDTYTATGQVFDLSMSTGHVFAAAGGQGLLVLKAGPSALTYGGRHDSPGVANEVKLAGDRAYLSDGREGWAVLDVSSPVSPASLGSFAAPRSSVAALAVSGDSVFLVDGAAGLDVLNVSTVATPVAEAAFDALSLPLKADVSGTTVLIGEDADGMAIFDRDRGDSDGDGLDDALEQRIVDANPSDGIDSLADVAPDGDFDGDGLTNAQEQAAGTDATDAASVFMVAATESDGPSRFTLHWHSEAGMYYSVHRASSPGGTFELLQANMPATPPLNTFTDVLAPSQRAFYMVGVSE